MLESAGYNARSKTDLLHEAETMAENEKALPALGYLHNQLVFAKFETVLGANDAIRSAKTQRFIRRLAKHVKERSEFYARLAELLEQASE